MVVTPTEPLANFVVGLAGGPLMILPHVNRYVSKY